MPLILTPRQFSQRAELYHQLSQLISAGIGVVPALEQIKRHPPGPGYRELLQRFLEKLAEGRTLFDTVQSGDWLPAFDTALINAGERSGRLDACFRLLAAYYNDRARVTKLVISQLVYPVALIHIAAFVFLIVLPFAASQFNADLLWLCFRAALVLAPLYGGVAVMVYALQSKHGESWRAFVESLLRPVPLLGTARHCLALSRLATALEALISAGVNIIDSWELAATACGSPALRRVVAAWRPEVVAGRTPAELVQECGRFPETFANLYTSGEISGKLDDSLQRLHRYYDEEGSLKLHAFAQWTPRLVYFLVALLIAWKIIGFWLSYFDLINTATHF